MDRLFLTRFPLEISPTKEQKGLSHCYSRFISAWQSSWPARVGWADRAGLSGMGWGLRAGRGVAGRGEAVARRGGGVRAAAGR